MSPGYKQWARIAADVGLPFNECNILHLMARDAIRDLSPARMTTYDRRLFYWLLFGSPERLAAVATVASLVPREHAGDPAPAHACVRYLNGLHNTWLADNVGGELRSMHRRGFTPTDMACALNDDPGARLRHARLLFFGRDIRAAVHLLGLRPRGKRLPEARGA